MELHQFVQTQTSSTADDLECSKIRKFAKHYNWLIRAQVILRRKKF
jgi:hypothetical protein